MPDEMDNYQNFHGICTIAKVEMESSVVLDERNGGTVAGNDSTTTASRLPPGFRFHPTDEELVSYYLKKKIENNHYNFEAIDEVNLNRCEPWDLPAKAKVGENAWYFFSLRDRKYPTGMRTNRATDAGYWKATGKDREVMSSVTDRLVGMKKTLVFYLGRAPKGEKTNWIMHEYRIEGESSRSPVTEWVVCRVFKKNAALRKSAEGHDHPGGPNYQLELEDNESSFDHQSSTYLPPLTDSPSHHQSQSHVLSSTHASAGFTTPGSSVDYRQQQHHHQAGAGAAGASQNEHDLQQLQNSRPFNMNDFNFNANWAIRRQNLMHIQGVANTIESLVSGISGNWESVVPLMPSTNDADWPGIWDSPSG